jgi:tetratricopeptide (TPR) repeat protein
MLSKDGKYARAEVAARRSVPLARLRTGEVSENHAAAVSQFANCLRNLGKYYEAEGLYRQALEMTRATIGEAHPSYAMRLNNLALVVQEQGRFEEAEGLFRQVLEIDRATIGEAHPDYATGLNNLARAVQARGGLRRPARFSNKPSSFCKLRFPPIIPTSRRSKRTSPAFHHHPPNKINHPANWLLYIQGMYSLCTACAPRERVLTHLAQPRQNRQCARRNTGAKS